MADHFEEIVDLRLRALESRVDDEAGAVKEHFLELRQFITESLAAQMAQLRGEMDAFRTEVRGEMGILRSEMGILRGEMGILRGEMDALRGDVDELRADLGRLGQRLGAFQDLTRLEFSRLEQKADAHHQATHLVLQDILRRLPPTAA